MRRLTLILLCAVLIAVPVSAQIVRVPGPYVNGAGVARGPVFVPVGSYAVIGNTAKSSKLTTGLTIKQGAADDEILSLASSDVAHGMTTNADTDTYGTVTKLSGTAGGVALWGFSEGVAATALVGSSTAGDSTKSSAGQGSVLLNGYLKSGTTIGAMSANANIVAIRNNTSSVWIADTDGDTWQSGTVTSAGFLVGAAAGIDKTCGGPVVSATFTKGILTAMVCTSEPQPSPNELLAEINSLKAQMAVLSGYRQ